MSVTATALRSPLPATLHRPHLRRLRTMIAPVLTKHGDTTHLARLFSDGGPPEMLCADRTVDLKRTDRYPRGIPFPQCIPCTIALRWP